MEGRRQPLAKISIDSEQLEKGENIGISHQRAIQSSAIQMGGRRQPLAEISRGNTATHKSQKQSNKHKPLPILGVPIPIGKENVNAGADTELLATSGVKSKIVRKNVKWGPNPNYVITEEDKQIAQIWAREGIEKIFGLSGRDTDVLKQKLVEEEEKRCLAQASSYRCEIPNWLELVGNHLGAPVEHSNEVKDRLDLAPEEDMSTVFPKAFLRMEQQDVDHDDSLYEECLEILSTPFKGLAVIDECM